jgi:hypothetical protein
MGNNIVTVDVTELKAAIFDELINDYYENMCGSNCNELALKVADSLIVSNRTIELMQELAEKRDKETENNGSE